MIEKIKERLPFKTFQTSLTIFDEIFGKGKAHFKTTSLSYLANISFLYGKLQGTLDSTT